MNKEIIIKKLERFKKAEGKYHEGHGLRKGTVEDIKRIIKRGYLTQEEAWEIDSMCGAGYIFSSCLYRKNNSQKISSKYWISIKSPCPRCGGIGYEMDKCSKCGHIRSLSKCSYCRGKGEVTERLFNHQHDFKEIKEWMCGSDICSTEKCKICGFEVDTTT